MATESESRGTPETNLDARLAAATEPGPAQGPTATQSPAPPQAPPSFPKHHDPNAPTAKKKMAIQSTGLKKYFGRQKVLDGVDIGIPEGEITMIMGPSGTGKSGLL